MAKNSITDFDNTAANNTDIQSVNIDENCPASGINNAIRELMADLADVNDGTVALESPKFDSIKDGNIKPPDASGTDVAGTATTIKGGAGTGTGAGGSIVFQTADGGSTGSSVNAHATAMTITDDGKVGIGTASPSWNIHAFQSGALNSIFESDTGNSNIRITSGDGDNAQIFFGDQTNDTISIIRHDNSDNSLQFHAGAIERMRVLSNSGSLLLGATTAIATGANTDRGVQLHKDYIWIANDDSTYMQRPAGGNGNFIRFYKGSAQVGRIRVSGSSTLYDTTSDYRLKENVVDMSGAITRVKQLQPKRFNFIADADITVDGFLAHEAQTVVPEAVGGTHNEVDADGNPEYQSIDQSKLVPLLTGALQEAIAKIEALETRVTALENA